MKSLLIVGMDSRLGKIIFNHSKSRFNVYGTTRRIKNCLEKYIKYLDLSEDNFESFKNINYDYCIICAGITNYNEVAQNNSLSRKVNIEGVAKLSKFFLDEGTKICFVSTNTVLGQDSRNEFSYHSPEIEYSIQKAETEKLLINFAKENNFSENLLIVRLTKNVSLDTSPFLNWMEKLSNYEPIDALNDLWFSPITFKRSANFILNLLTKDKEGGIYHCSGEKDLSYYEFALILARKLNINSSLISSKKSYELGLKLLYNQKITKLEMLRTEKLIQEKPMKPENVAIELINDFKKMND